MALDTHTNPVDIVLNTLCNVIDMLSTIFADIPVEKVMIFSVLASLK